MIKVEISPVPKQAPTYPYLGTWQGMIVLFTCGKTGTVLRATPAYAIGYFSSTWAEGEFIPFNGSVTLSNE